MKENRLFRIIYYILHHQKVTAKQLATKFEVSIRTIYRDLNVLTSVGIPLDIQLGRNGGIQIKQNFVLNKALFSLKEQQTILQATQNFASLDKSNQGALINKLTALFNQPVDDWLEIDFNHWSADITTNNLFTNLKSAIILQQAINIVYVSSAYMKTTRVIYPLKLTYKTSNWYLKAYCTLKNDFRLFKLNRIISFTVLKETFPTMKYPDYPKEQQDNQQEVILHFPAKLAFRIYDEFSNQAISQLENGDLSVATKLIIDDRLISYLLSFQGNVEVISPISLEHNLANASKNIYEKYRFKGDENNG